MGDRSPESEASDRLGLVIKTEKRDRNIIPISEYFRGLVFIPLRDVPKIYIYINKTKQQQKQNKNKKNKTHHHYKTKQTKQERNLENKETN